MEDVDRLGVPFRKRSASGATTSPVPESAAVRAVEIFSGCGGLALGTAQAGFEHLAVVELDPYACETIRENQRRKHPLVKNWPLHEVDVREFEYANLLRGVDLLCAGLPCQPFSLGGKAKGHRDNRDMFSEVVRAAGELRPKAILIENVKGLVRSTFKTYFDYLLLAIASPGLARIGRQGWTKHFEKLRQREEGGATDDLRYDVHVHAVNAADFGVPQWRDRVLIVAFRSDLKISWTAPQPTHGLDQLLWSQWRSGDYWKRHGLVRQRPGLMSQRLAQRLAIVRELEERDCSRAPWRTVRDAIENLPKPTRARDDGGRDHCLRAGARAYEGHQGSFLDEPAKTLKAGAHGVPGGENSIALSRGRLRYFTIRECARLQTFPDDYVIAGPWTRAMRQIGNAVPVLLGRTMAERIRDHLSRLQRPVTPPGSVIDFSSEPLARRKAG
jgi:DNA (cytosine-5)-methyltransferase 1